VPPPHAEIVIRAASRRIKVASLGKTKVCARTMRSVATRKAIAITKKSDGRRNNRSGPGAGGMCNPADRAVVVICTAIVAGVLSENVRVAGEAVQVAVVGAPEHVNAIL
jgi:hypothetical protein